MRTLARMVVLLSALLASCGGDLTEILVVVDSDLPVPDALDGLRVEVSGTESMTAEGSLRGNGIDLPRTVGVVHRGGGLGPITVRAVGTLGGVEVVSARAITSFIEGRTLVLPLFLSRTCVGATCAANETCSGGACASAAVDPESLEEWNGSVGRLDGGPTCEPNTERCNGTDDDCDGRTDEGFDLESDPLTCGSCFTVCPTNHSTPSCVAGRCEIASCETGFDDCDDDPGNGCEADLSSSRFHCGACDAPCSAPNATPVCTSGACGLGACDAGFDDCNGDPADGCEAALDTLADCGACGVTCGVPGATATCAGGTCTVEGCMPGFGDCNADPVDGCEAMLDSIDNCGACAFVCALPNAAPICAGGACAIAACNPGFDDCDGIDANGCESTLDTLANCGACGATCALPNATETCATGTCEIDTCDSGRGDCDGVAANGCEADLLRDEPNCGLCGIVCTGSDRCRSGVCR